MAGAGTAEQSYGRGIVYVLLAVIGWSLSGVFVRFLPDLSGWQINCWRGYWMSVALLIYLYGAYGREAHRRFLEIPWPGLVGAAFFFAFGSTLYVTSLTYASTAVVSVIGALSPIFTGLMAPWIIGERAGLSAWIAAGMALVGVAVIGWNGLAAGSLLGLIVSLGVPICFAGQTVTLRRYRAHDMMPAICVGGFATFIIAGIFGGGFDVTLREVLILAVMGPVQLAIPLIFYGKGARSVPAVALSLIVMLDVILNPLWSWIGVGEEPTPSAYIGGAIIVAAVILCIAGGRLFAFRANLAARRLETAKPLVKA
jgi:drug/metabolite transporter, DME family